MAVHHKGIHIQDERRLVVWVHSHLDVNGLAINATPRRLEKASCREPRCAIDTRSISGGVSVEVFFALARHGEAFRWIIRVGCEAVIVLGGIFTFDWPPFPLHDSVDSIHQVPTHTRKVRHNRNLKRLKGISVTSMKD